MMHAARRAFSAVLIGGVVALGGCATGGGEAVGVEPVMMEVGDTAAAFGAAKDVLREFRFELDRVDAVGGVITTKASTASGWATPWKNHASDWDGAWRDTLQDEARVVRVEFYPVNTGESSGRFGVVVERVRVTRFGRRVDPTSPRRFKRTSVDPIREGVESEVVGRDPGLEARIGEAILGRIGACDDAKVAASADFGAS